MVAYGERRMDETPLVARALAGDEAAVAALYDRYADKLYDYARFLTGSSTDAGDITHDVFLVAMQRLSQLRDHAKFRPWVYAIMRTEVSRRRLRASRLHLGAWDDNSGEPVSSDLTPTRAAEIAELLDHADAHPGDVAAAGGTHHIGNRGVDRGGVARAVAASSAVVTSSTSARLTPG